MFWKGEDAPRMQRALLAFSMQILELEIIPRVDQLHLKCLTSSLVLPCRCSRGPGPHGVLSGHSSTLNTSLCY